MQRIGSSNSIVRIVSILLLCVFADRALFTQTAAQPPVNKNAPDALELLKEASSLYSHLSYYYIEATEEVQFVQDYHRDILREQQTAAVQPGNRYRFETKSSLGTFAQISDGKTEWLYDSGTAEYLQQPTPTDGYENPAMAKMDLLQVQAVQGIARGLSRIQNDVGSAQFLADETIELGGHSYSCRVILELPKNDGKQKEHNLAMSIYWIDKGTHAIRKAWHRAESINEIGFTPGEQLTDTTETYPVVEFGSSPAAVESLFSFTPPPSASKVLKLSDPLEVEEKNEDTKSKAAASLAEAGTKPAGEGSETLAYLKKVADRYAQATYFHIEAVDQSYEEGRFTGGNKTERIISILAPDNHYRFEVAGTRDLFLQVANGKNEWVVQPETGQYVQQAAPNIKVDAIKLPFAQEMVLNRARNAASNLADVLKKAQSAIFLPDEVIDINGSKYNCRVVLAQTPRRQRDGSLTVYWIDKDTLFIRKTLVHRDRPVIGSEAAVSDDTSIYPVVELGTLSAIPESQFAYTPPGSVSRVAEFEQGGLESLHTAAVENKPAPEITFVSATGQKQPLKAWQGRPVLLDFWATWCGPCIASLPGVEKIFHEYESKGLAVVSVDEDDSAKDASDFLEDHKRPWPNFHDDKGTIRDAFPKKGIPYFVLIDAKGQIVYASIGFFDSELRAAIAKLGPPFASVTSSPASLTFEINRDGE